MRPNHMLSMRKQLLGTIVNVSNTFTNMNCFDCFMICNVAVVQLLLVLWFATLLSCSSCLFCGLQHCCGEAPARFLIRNVVLVKLLFVL